MFSLRLVRVEISNNYKLDVRQEKRICYPLSRGSNDMFTVLSIDIIASLSIDITVWLSIDSAEIENIYASYNVSMCPTHHRISISQLS